MSPGACGRCSRLQRAGERGPALGLHQRGVEPFLELGQPGQRAAHDLVKELLREPERQRVDGLDGGQLGRIGGRQDVIGVRHLHARAVFLHPAGNKARLVQRQQPFDAVAAAMKEDNVERAALVLADHAHGRAMGTLGRRVVLHRRYQERRDAPRHGTFDGRRNPAVEIARGQVPKQIDHTRRGHRLGQQLADQLFAARAKARKAPQRRVKALLAKQGFAGGRCVWRIERHAPWR